ncbi:unnamed protein product [Rotaria sp. Silwood2]|nr:unnamed protein product [Rotaria sp. Silwood2]CAF2783147.1 unnamed protein product [Rotaria sp. Silwood2]CAF3193938.1 unnamed protein product [Rotaria sp. Silwood2]CAF4025060.1 unnamed protein product [Rotaria sp. Silwood2]CAF4048749.1 unnamed protein product [Rotaria sp. Silwood2]
MSILYKILLCLTLCKLCVSGYPPSYCVHFDTDVNGSKNPIIINITQNWSPIGANHLFDIINSDFYSVPSAFFRVVPNFVVQFGISGDPIQNTIWNEPIQDDPVKMSNSKGTLSYATAGPNTRTTQLFINYVNNPRLDSLGFSPLGIVTTGFDTALAIFNPTPGSTDGVDQDQYAEKGNKWIIDNYPQINFIEKVSITYNCPFTN